MQHAKKTRLRDIVSWVLAGLFLLTACNSSNSPAGSGSTGDQTSPLTLEQAEQVAETFLKGWREGDYSSMYGLISPNSRDAYAPEDFTDEYQDAAIQITLTSLDTQITNSLRQGTTAAIQYDVTFHSEMFSDIQDSGRIMRLIETPEGWRVAWSTMDIFAELSEGARLERQQTMPGRGNIYDRNGKVMADQNGRAIGLYLVRQDIANEDECIALMSRIFHREVADLQADFQKYNPDTLFPIGEVDPETYQQEEQNLLEACAIGDDAGDTVVRNTRRYFGEVAPHVIGYVGQLQPEQLAEYEKKGYPADAMIGQTGIEKSYEDWLAGKPGGDLVITSPTGGDPLRVLAEAQATPGQSIYLTIDRDLQTAVQQAFAEAYNEGTATWSTTSPGAAAVVMNVKTGEILAMVSYPGFDPSLFNPDSPAWNRVDQITALENDWRSPLLNRTTMGTYPAGSVFKIISTAAGLDSGVYNANTGINCTGTWYGHDTWGDGLPYRTDWLATGHGWVDFPHALAYSCDPYYWELGANLHQKDPQLLTNYAYKMGLGVNTGLTDLPEAIGQIPNNDLIFQIDARNWNISDSLNLVIGQGPLQITPLQITRMVAAVANGGTLWKPYLVDKVQIIGEPPAYQAQPAALSVLNFAPSTFELIRQAMCDVTMDPSGTARYMFEEWYDFQGTAVVVCGKTGTAQTGAEGVKPQAWFAAFAPQDDPEIAIAVIVENSCEGSEVAAPIVRRIVEDYYHMPHGAWPTLWQSGCTTLDR